MSDTAMISRSGPFWEFLAGRQPAPPAAATLGWELSWVAPERGEIEVFFDARAGFANPMGNVQGGFLAAMLDDTLGPALIWANEAAKRPGAGLPVARWPGRPAGRGTTPPGHRLDRAVAAAGEPS